MSRLRKGTLALVATLTVSGLLAVTAPAAVAHPTAHAWPVVARGATGENVYTIQYMLRAHGSEWLWADGWHGVWFAGRYWTPASTNSLSIWAMRWYLGTRWVPATWAYHLWWWQGWYRVPLNGTFDWRTMMAVSHFQWHHGLFPDGVVGPATWQALIVGSGLGSRGPAVRALQRQLGLTIDGYFGTHTRDHVLMFQDTHGLVESGVANLRTWRELVTH